MPKTLKVDPKKWYSLLDAAELLPLVRGYKGARALVLRDMQNGNHLRPMIRGEGPQTRYLIKGERIIKFTQAVEAGKVRL